MQGVQVPGERFAERCHAVVVSVEGATGSQRLNRGVADERRRRRVALAEPELEDVLAPEAGVRHLAHLGKLEPPHGVACDSLRQGGTE